MKFFNKYILGAFAIASTLALGGEGTLPFGKGQVPFNMFGKVTLSGQPNSMSLSFNRSRLRLNGESESSRCPGGMQQHSFSGTVDMNGKSYRISAICSNGRSQGRRYILGQSGSARITLDGSLSGSTFSGTASIGLGGAQKSYRFSLSE